MTCQLRQGFSGDFAAETGVADFGFCAGLVSAGAADVAAAAAGWVPGALLTGFTGIVLVTGALLGKAIPEVMLDAA